MGLSCISAARFRSRQGTRILRIAARQPARSRASARPLASPGANIRWPFALVQGIRSAGIYVARGTRRCLGRIALSTRCDRSFRIAGRLRLHPVQRNCRVQGHQGDRAADHERPFRLAGALGPLLSDSCSAGGPSLPLSPPRARVVPASRVPLRPGQISSSSKSKGGSPGPPPLCTMSCLRSPPWGFLLDAIKGLLRERKNHAFALGPPCP